MADERNIHTIRYRGETFSLCKPLNALALSKVMGNPEWLTLVAFGGIKLDKEEAVCNDVPDLEIHLVKGGRKIGFNYKNGNQWQWND